MKVSDLRGILQYVPRFREKIFVVEVDGDVIASKNFGNILLDLAVLRSLNIKVVLVHGAAHQIQKLAAQRGVAISNADGTGVTDDATLQLSLEAAIQITNEIMQGLTSVDLRAAYANAIIAHPFGIRGGVDYLQTGKVERVDIQALQLFLDQGIIPVVPPFGFDGEGKTFRVNSDSIAYELGEALRATKIIYLMAGDGLCVNGEVVRQLSIDETEEILKRRKLKPNLASKLDFGARACRSDIPRVHLLNGLVNEALLSEVFSHEGIGTMIYSNEYQQIRRVFKKDVRGVMDLIRQSVHNEELIRRTRSDILDSIDDYWVLEIDRNLVGCVALHCYPEEQKAELACLYVNKAYGDQGYGQKLMNFVERLAGEKGMRHIFALSTQAFSFFQQKGGYHEVAPADLPPARRQRYDASHRRSKVLMKEVTPETAVELQRHV
ncbi:MAG: amino-acid N-acetyltransferase [Chthoniobacteraceae bacterium]|nr:amino-acid N-acetyltransferase [Chthoniobacteraceae bacterium]